MSDEERELVPSEPAEAPSPTDIPPEEAVEALPSAAIDEVMPTLPPVEAEAPSMPGAVEAGRWLGGRHRSAHPAGGPDPTTARPCRH